MIRHAALLAGCPAALLAGPAFAQEVQTASFEAMQDLSGLSIEELAQRSLYVGTRVRF